MLITSNTSSMPEIAGHEAILVNPGSSDEIAEMMLQLERNEDLYEKQKALGLERSKLFSWRKTTENLITVDGDSICRELGSPKVLNMVMLGEAIRSGILPFTTDDAAEAMKKSVKPQFVELNEKALRHNM